MRVLAAVMLLTVSPLSVSLAQAADQGGFVTLLGDDTIAVERFSRTETLLEGERVLRFPQTSVIQYSARLGRNGRVTRFTATHRSGAQLDGPPTWTSTTEFESNAAVSKFTRGASTETIRVTTGSEASPLLFHSYALYEQAARQAGRARSDTVPVVLVYPGNPEATYTWASARGRDSMAIGYFHEDAGIARFDSAGRMLSFDARGTVLKIVATRVSEIDAMAIARQFAASDAAGHAPGAISPRDTARGAIGEARITIDYSRPSKRGRSIFGDLIPWGQVWRTGADAATQFSTSRDLILREAVLKAGSYTLWTVPTPDGATLIVNAQTGQWGTDHDARQDFMRLPLIVRSMQQPVERFTIEIVAVGDSTELRFLWDTTEWALPLRAKLE